MVRLRDHTIFVLRVLALVLGAHAAINPR